MPPKQRCTSKCLQFKTKKHKKSLSIWKIAFMSLFLAYFCCLTFKLIVLWLFQVDSVMLYFYSIVYHSWFVSLTLHHEKENSGIMGNMLSDGSIVGVTGNTGRSTGYHLHLTCKKDGKSFNPTSLLNLIEKSFALSALSMSKWESRLPNSYTFTIQNFTSNIISFA